jgi:mRNA interferase HigB
VRVISLRPLREFWDLHPDARDPLRLWYRTAVKALWRNLHDFWRTYANANADAVRNEAGETLTVFNIGGNKYRLIARIRYDRALVNVRHVLTHDEYDRGRWKE